MAIEALTPRSYLRRPLVVVVAVIALIFGLSHWQLSTFVITPGNATNVPPLIKVDSLQTNKHPDQIMLVDVYLSQLNVWSWLLSQFQSHQEYVTIHELLQPGIPVNQLDAQGFLQMQDAKQAAEVSALRALGWKIPLRASGAIVTGVFSHSPADKAGIHVGDEFISVNSTPVTNACSLLHAIAKLPANTVISAEVKKVKISAKGALSWSGASMVHLTTAAVAKSQSSDSCGGEFVARSSYVGVSSEDGVSSPLPAHFTINTNYIGGPSAGLAMTLSLIDKLSAGSLTGHTPIAVSGTMDLYGNVGDVGGVAEKTVAVSATGAKYFIVPQVEVGVARANARPGLKIIGVTTLQEALRALRAIGGGPIRPLSSPVSAKN
jgi:PDZ domain-containing protein